MTDISPVTVVTSGNAAKAAIQAGNTLSRVLEDADGPILLLFSGGSALKILDSLRPNVFSSCVTFTVLDERCSSDPAASNYLKVLMHPVMKKAIGRGARSINTTASAGETPTKLAAKFEHELRKWKIQFPDGKIIATVGMGPDGHTFGMIPYAEDPLAFDRMFVHTDHWVVGYDAGDKNQYPLRVTTTVPFAGLITASIWYVSGQEKTVMLQRAMDPSIPVHVVPARIILDMNDVTLFTDCPLTK